MRICRRMRNAGITIQRTGRLLIHVHLRQGVGQLLILLLERIHRGILLANPISQRAAPQQRSHRQDCRDTRHRQRQEWEMMIAFLTHSWPDPWLVILLQHGLEIEPAAAPRLRPAKIMELRPPCGGAVGQLIRAIHRCGIVGCRCSGVVCPRARVNCAFSPADCLSGGIGCLPDRIVRV
jgi:hypothetical protein